MPYLPSGFVEVGSYDELQEIFRFSSLHNDVIPAISDMVRWSLKLPNRFALRSLSASDIGNDESPLTVEIDFPALGLANEIRVISEPRASDTMRKVMEILASVMGQDVLKKVVAMREGRRPLVSPNPDRDFRIGETDKTYQHQQIGTTGFFVLTNTDSAQKLKDLKEVAGTLGFPAHHFRVRAMAA